jgi:CRP-like cAMP-binding protein
VMASRISQAARLVTVRSLGTVRERLAYDLLERASDQLLRGEASSLRVTHEELAESIGSAREVVSRVLGELRRSGVINASPGVLSVLELERLAAIVEGLI